MPEPETPATPETAVSEPETPELPGERKKARRRARRGWWLPPVLALLAMGFQYAFDVPKAEMLQRETAAEKKAKKKAKAKAKRDKRKQLSKKKHGWVPRGAKEIAELRRTWSTEAFEKEPVDQRFRRHHEALLRSAATKIRAAALAENERAPIQIRPGCRTLRCDLELCAPSDLLTDMSLLLPELVAVTTRKDKTTREDPLWHELREIEPKSKPGPQDYQCRRWLVDFASESTTTKQIQLKN